MSEWRLMKHKKSRCLMSYVSEKRNYYVLILFFERVVDPSTLSSWYDRRIVMQAAHLKIHRTNSHFDNSQACSSRDTINRWRCLDSIAVTQAPLCSFQNHYVNFFLRSTTIYVSRPQLLQKIKAQFTRLEEWQDKRRANPDDMRTRWSKRVAIDAQLHSRVRKNYKAIF